MLLMKQQLTRLGNAPRNALYTSWHAQNKISSFFAKQFSNEIVNDMTNVKYFSVLADKTSDIGHVEQFCLSVLSKITRFIKYF